MRWGRVEATGGFFLLLAWLIYLDRHMLVPLALAACVLHELGHYVAIRLLGGDVKLIRLTAVGVEMEVRYPLSYWREGLAALAGPGMNLLLALPFSAWEGGVLFSGLNLALGCFNLLPAGRLDGGRALYCTLALAAGQGAADRVSVFLERCLTLILLLGGLWLLKMGGNLTLLLASLWLAVGGWSKKSAIRTCQPDRKQVK